MVKKRCLSLFFLIMHNTIFNHLIYIYLLDRLLCAVYEPSLFIREFDKLYHNDKTKKTEKEESLLTKLHQACLSFIPKAAFCKSIIHDESVVITESMFTSICSDAFETLKTYPFNHDLYLEVIERFLFYGESANDFCQLVFHMNSSEYSEKTDDEQEFCFKLFEVCEDFESDDKVRENLQKAHPTYKYLNEQELRDECIKFLSTIKELKLKRTNKT